MVVGCRHDSDPVLLWLWGRPAAAAPTGPLAWETLYAVGGTLKKTKKKKEKNMGKELWERGERGPSRPSKDFRF